HALQCALEGAGVPQEAAAPLGEDAEVVEDAGQPVLVADLLVDGPSLPQIRLRLVEAAHGHVDPRPVLQARGQTPLVAETVPDGGSRRVLLEGLGVLAELV